jgi:hypothetical protein
MGVGAEACPELVEGNDKPEGKHKRWMYVYPAVDVFTYDLLHLDIYPHHGKDEAQAFLQTLKAKGYRPQVIALVLYGQVQGDRYDPGLRRTHPCCLS